jgi:diguanylate cyclase (GGDEF)-like protein
MFAGAKRTLFALAVSGCAAAASAAPAPMSASAAASAASSAASAAASASVGGDFAQRIAALRAAAYLQPRTVLQELERLKDRTGPLTPAQRGQVLEVAANAEFWLQESGEGLKLAAQLEQLGREQHDDVLLAKGMLDRAAILSKKIHDTLLARQLIHQAADIAAGTGDVWVRTRALVSLAQLSAEDGEPEAGLPLARRAVALARGADDCDAMLMALRAHAGLLATLGRFKDAFDAVDESNRLAKRRGLPIQVVRAILTDSEISVRAGRAERARAALRDAVAMLQTMKAEEALPGAMVRLAEAEQRAGNVGRAQALAMDARAMAAARKDRDGVAAADFALGLAQVRLHQSAAGQQSIEHALAWFREDERYVPMLLDYGHALALAGDRDTALKVYDDAGRTLLALSRRDKELARESVIAAAEIQKKASENQALNRENAGKQRALDNERKLKTLWWALSIVCTLGCLVTVVLYRRIRVANRSLRALNTTLYEQSTSDALTGLRNRNYFYQRAAGLFGPESMAADARMGAFFLMDIDRFKSINDTWGHAVGDVVLRAVADRLAESVRGDDLLMRWGGEEFLVFVPDIDAIEAGAFARRLLHAVHAEPVIAGELSIPTSVSVGFALWPMRCDGAPLGWERVVHLADLALYLSKAGGRNRAHGVCGPQALTAAALAAMERDLGQAAQDGLVELPCIRCDAAPHHPAAVDAQAAAPAALHNVESPTV